MRTYIADVIFEERFADECVDLVCINRAATDSIRQSTDSSAIPLKI